MLPTVGVSWPRINKDSRWSLQLYTKKEKLAKSGRCVGEEGDTIAEHCDEPWTCIYKAWAGAVH